MLYTGYLNDRFVGVPFIRIQVQSGNELHSHIVEHGGKFHTPVADGGVRDLDVKGGFED